MTQFPASLTEEDRAILNSVDRYLTDGLALKRWWDSAEPQNLFDEQFGLTTDFHRPSKSYGFFAKTQVENRTMPLMGNVQDLFFDRPKTPPDKEKDAAEWMQKQLREFVLHYFMRVSSFQQPESALVSNQPAPPSWLANLSLCPPPRGLREGFGYSQVYYKTTNGEIGKFTDPYAIIDVREVGTKYEWIVLKVKILNFNVKARPFGQDGPEMAFTLDEESHLVMTRDFILDQDPVSGTPGRYGIGYAFLKNPKPGFIAGGPGEFDAAIELIEFRISETGEISSHMVFVVNRPDRIANVPLDPVDWSFRIANILSLGTASWFLRPLRDTLELLPLRFGTFDPVYPSLSLLNVLTANQAADRLCLSRDMLDKFQLVQHFKQHYATIIGCLPTWRQIPNWLDDESKLPESVVTGRS